MKVIITIPAYDEEETIGNTLEDINEVMDKTSYDYKIHVQDDGSTDMTKEIAELHNAKIFSNDGNLGLAKTFKAEMENAKDADIIVHTDADNQYKAEHIPELIRKVEEGYDLVLGSRFLNKDRYKGMFLKRIGNRIFAKLMTGLTKMELSDGTTGFRAFNQKVAKLPITNRFTYTHEQIIRAKRKKYKVCEIPIGTNYTRDSKLFKSPFQYLYKSLINLIRLYRDFDPIKFFGGIGLSIMAIGGLLWVGMIINFILTRHIGPLNLTIAADFLLGFGFTIMMIGLLADMNVED